MANLNENLSELLGNALAAAAERSSAPVEQLGKEKHVDDLCAHFVWNNGQQTVFLCPKAVEKGAVFTTVGEALQNHPELAEKLRDIPERDGNPPENPPLDENTLRILRNMKSQLDSMIP